MASSCIFVNAGQCGNQLGYSVLDSLFSHLSSESSSSSNHTQDIWGGDVEMNVNSFFRQSRGTTGRRERMIARAVCLDTEPKVVNECLQRTMNSKHRWTYDQKCITYRHGGAGNNWAMGYEMCSGDFLEAAMDSIRRELEHCDVSPCLILTHSVAGGTGSGLGTRITETSCDEFSDVSRINIAVTPYHFGEVVVQHYNTLLCLSKISKSSHGVLIFENEVAQNLCKKMRGLERPTLADINSLIASNIVPVLLPKYEISTTTGAYLEREGMPESFSKSSSSPSKDQGQQMQMPLWRSKSSFSDDITHLCSHPGYKFVDVKITPQTSTSSIEFTYDSWTSVLSTLERMHFHGASCDRGLGSIHSITGVGSGGGASLAGVDVRDSMSSISRLRQSQQSLTSNSASSSSPSAFQQEKGTSHCSLGSILTLRGPDSRAAALTINRSNPTHMSHAKIFSRPGRGEGSPVHSNQSPLSFQASYSDILGTDPLKVCYSSHITNGYSRSASLLSNGQSILPVLQRAATKAAQMYQAKAYLHQYQSCGLEEETFKSSFLQIGQIIANYNSLKPQSY